MRFLHISTPEQQHVVFSSHLVPGTATRCVFFMSRQWNSSTLCCLHISTPEQQQRVFLTFRQRTSIMCFLYFSTPEHQHVVLFSFKMSPKQTTRGKGKVAVMAGAGTLQEEVTQETEVKSEATEGRDSPPPTSSNVDVQAQSPKKKRTLSIYIPWPFPPSLGMADNTKRQQKTMGVLLRSSSNDEGPGLVWMTLLEQHSPSSSVFQNLRRFIDAISPIAPTTGLPL